MKCTLCGQEIRNLMGAKELLAKLGENPSLHVYRSKDNRWFLTYGGGEVNPNAIKTLVARKRLFPVYSSCPEDAYHIRNETFDVERTMAYRTKTGRYANFNVGDP